ncbi:hypothetical protein H6S82_08510 [Planktothrix sp. FACHB-1355]|uniref:Uncharacterized protein n=1 Tax=Aerosakkonema funiforme FACHB-1375 TaxID=2949571 RepID=A0A926ZH58_9CYAN|nr:MULTISPECIES: hypothetical protein [Oscillatoriales]MBD2182933.1 hypothetical protein [Aerosakkonema funiforme FACHB-1375]MBD3558899.1 hypothetical protein [Planktothrix sp. FACHB-1355]
MATIASPTLTLTPFTEGGQQKVKIEVKYNVTFTANEVILQTDGFKFQEVIQVLGVDAPSPVDQVLVSNILPTQDITIPGAGVAVSRTRTAKALRKDLQEDPTTGDADEIRCSIQIIPVAASAFTNTVSLAG